MSMAPNFHHLILTSVVNAEPTKGLRLPAEDATAPSLQAASKDGKVLATSDKSLFMRYKRKAPGMRASSRASKTKFHGTLSQPAKGKHVHGSIPTTSKQARDTQTTGLLDTKEKFQSRKIATTRKLPPLEHSLFIGYKDASTNWNTEVSTSLNQDLSLVVEKITATLLNAVNKSNTLFATHSELIAVPAKPLADQLLRIRLDIGTKNEQAYDARLGDQMARFQDVVRNEHQTLKYLWNDWGRITREIAGLMNDETDGVESDYSIAVNKLTMEYEVERCGILSQYNHECNDLQRKLKESDTAMEHIRHTQKLQVRQMVQLQLRAIEQLGFEED